MIHWSNFGIVTGYFEFSRIACINFKMFQQIVEIKTIGVLFSVSYNSEKKI